jgi:hypothetical protein
MTAYSNIKLWSCETHIWSHYWGLELMRHACSANTKATMSSLWLPKQSRSPVAKLSEKHTAQFFQWYGKNPCQSYDSHATARTVISALRQSCCLMKDMLKVCQTPVFCQPCRVFGGHDITLTAIQGIQCGAISSICQLYDSNNKTVTAMPELWQPCRYYDSRPTTVTAMPSLWRPCQNYDCHVSRYHSHVSAKTAMPVL